MERGDRSGAVHYYSLLQTVSVAGPDDVRAGGAPSAVGTTSNGTADRTLILQGPAR